ncbi:TPA: phage integrase [Legionella pneumophila]|uniref:site-specific integrase n=1 Tax=Legionella pneumophila TaxID=446 RepID=UPI000776C4EA|nr:site-specific integrase [Legionella pneumophila]HAU0830007.1 site-specific integrase [Legionella pneumophila]HAU1873683.1 site-specific integrase [Legionella pneumophila]HBD7058521.1 site-specific integrase [Legionella pneumophila]HCQ3574020.1 site-specific integrase [Legionella pneumophila]HEM7041170.1 site-specific integrase [Legionella pneumophila]
MKAKINNTLVKKLLPKDKEYEVHDTDLKGFILRVFPSGTMRYVCQYKRGGKINIGTVGVITPAQAREKAVEILNDFNKGIDPKTKRGSNKLKTLGEFFENEYRPWVLTHHKRGDKTLATITRCFDKLFSKFLEEITPSIIEQWRIKRLNDGISNATLNRDIGTLKSLFTKAVEWGFIKENYLKNLKLSKIDRAPKVRYLSFDEERNLRQALAEREEQLKQDRKRGNEWRQVRGYDLLPEYQENDHCNYLTSMVLISINTGLRQGELFHLTWEMIDLQERSIIISGEITKNNSSRYIPLNDETYKIIKQLFEKSSLKKGLVFPSKDNKPFNNIKRSWKTVLKKAQITEFRWHDLRHHFASKLVMAGIDLNTVRELLGHSDIKMTLRYAHLAPEHKIKAVNKINWTD